MTFWLDWKVGKFLVRKVLDENVKIGKARAGSRAGLKFFEGGVLKIVLGSSHRSGEATSACLRSRHAPLGGSGGMPPRKILRKMVQICAIWCILAVFWEVIQRQEIYIMYNQSDLKTSCLWIFVVVKWRVVGEGALSWACSYIGPPHV